MGLKGLIKNQRIIPSGREASQTQEVGSNFHWLPATFDNRDEAVYSLGMIWGGILFRGGFRYPISLFFFIKYSTYTVPLLCDPIIISLHVAYPICTCVFFLIHTIS